MIINVKDGRFSFKNGWFQVKQGDVKSIRQELMDALNITTRMSFNDRLNGRIEPRVTEAETIERIFSEYGVTDIWGTN